MLEIERIEGCVTLSRDPCADQCEAIRRTGVRAFIRAEKAGNAAGAKEGREVNL